MDNISNAFEERNTHYESTIKTTVEVMSEQIAKASDYLTQSLNNEYSVRFLGAGRARLAASMAANRLCHAGAKVSIMGDAVPLPNTRLGGYIVAASASGTSEDVIVAMEKAWQRREGSNEGGRKIRPLTIPIIGISALSGKTHDIGDKEKTDRNVKLCNRFEQACDVFIHIQVKEEEKSKYNYLADNEEHAIMELLDLMVAYAINKAGIDILHEDLGPTGAVFAESTVETKVNTPDK